MIRLSCDLKDNIYFEKGCQSARDDPERFCAWFSVHCSSKKFKRMAQEAMDICLRVLKESNKQIITVIPRAIDSEAMRARGVIVLVKSN